jgi:hypothetical protein
VAGEAAGHGGRPASKARSLAILATDALFPIERITDVVDHWPERCGCGHVFGEHEREPAGAPARHKVVELPPLAVEISEHRLQRVCCPHCGHSVRAELPAGVPRGCFGPKLEAAIASLTVRNRLSRRQLVELLDELFGCPVGRYDRREPHSHRRDARAGLRGAARADRKRRRAQRRRDRLVSRRRAAHALGRLQQVDGGVDRARPRQAAPARAHREPVRGRRRLRSLQRLQQPRAGAAAGLLVRICAEISPSTPTSARARKRRSDSTGSR